MKYRQVGNSGIQVSVTCLGAMLFGKHVDMATAGRMADMARAAGVNFIDTAYSYQDGESEKVVGTILKPDRNRWILASKVGSRFAGASNESGLGRRRILSAIAITLSRLQTDHLDIYYCHQDDRETPLEETVGVMGELIRAGKIRHFGLSNHAAWRVAHIHGLCGQLGVPPPVICQPYYNLLNRTPEVELLPACDFFSIGVAPYSPIARGVLSGKYQGGSVVPADSRVARGDRSIMQTEYRAESLVIAQKIKAYAEGKGLTCAQFSYAWALNSRPVCAAVSGPRTLEQWQEYISAAEYELTAEDEQFVDGLVPPGHPSTHGYTDPRYPMTGRLSRSGNQT